MEKHYIFHICFYYNVFNSGIYIYYIGNIDSSDVFSLFGAIIGVFGAYWVATYQNKEVRKKEIEEKEAKIVIGSENYADSYFIAGYDFFDSDERKPEKLSNLTVPLINGGITSVYDIIVNYEVVNQKDYFSNYEAIKGLRSIKKENPFQENLMGIGFTEEDFVISFRNGKQKGSKTLKYKTYIDGIPVLLPHSSIEINIPYSYAALIQFVSTVILEGKSGDVKTINPVLKSQILYKDYLGEKREKIVYTTIHIRNVSEPEGEVKVNFTFKHFDNLPAEVD